ncbi:MAG: DNA polymerase III subunit delta' [Pseudomonadota bacterium]
MSEPLEADRLADAPHPRETDRVIGHGAALKEIATAIGGEALHHGWLFTGPRGVGKATVAWAMAHTLLARPLPSAGNGLFGTEAHPDVPNDLFLDPDHPIARRVLALSEPRLSLLRRPWDEKAGRLKADIPVDAARSLKRFLGMSAADGGYRVVIVDAADDMNPSAANAILKLLEEPPAATVFILISHRPGGLLPTIRSRCRVMRFAPLPAANLDAALRQTGAETPIDTLDQARLARLAGGSVGAAVGILSMDGLELYRTLVTTIGALPRHDRPTVLAMAEKLAARDAEAKRRLAVDLTSSILHTLAMGGATGQWPDDLSDAERQMLGRLSPSPTAARAWGEAQSRISQRFGHGSAVSLDPVSLILDMVATLDATASELSLTTGASP